MIPGDVSFITLQVTNESENRKVYQVQIDDPDSNFLEEQEVKMVYSPHEFEYWATRGEVRRPHSLDFLVSTDTIILSPGENVELLFKF